METQVLEKRTSRSKIPQVITIYNCRVCLFNGGSKPIFGDDAHPDISKEVASFGGVPVQENDDFPEYLCEDCFQNLQAAISFRKSARQVETQLRYRKKQKGYIITDIQSTPIKTEVKSQYINDDISDKTPNIDFISVKLDDTEKDVAMTIKNESLNDEETNEQFEDDLLENNSDPVMLIISEKKNTKKNFQCKLCKEKYRTSEEYDLHRESAEHKKNYIISFMPKKPKTSPKNLKTKHPKDKKCDICDRLFTKLHYPRHMRSQHQVAVETTRSVNKKECTICKKKMHPVAFNRHMKRVHGEGLPKIECPICKRFFSQDFYRLHMQRHENQTRNFICDQCGQKFYFKSTFYTHRLIHSNDLPHKCDYCPYRGRTKGLLKTHVRTHTGDYPYKCTQCDTRCLTKSNLNAHMQRHRGPVDFICDTCSRGFYSKLELERHISVVHQGIKNHVCNICGMAFGYRHGLMSHQLNVHKRAKGIGKAKAVYLRLEEQGLLAPMPDKDSSK